MADANQSCTFGNFSVTTEQHLQFFTYFCLLPFYIIVGLTSNITLLITFYRRSKIEQTYAYQVSLTVSKTLEIAAFGSFLLGLHWFSGTFSHSSLWFRQQYILMFLTLKIGPWAHVHFIISSLLLSVAMASDRVLALSEPLRYKKLNHQMRQIVSAIICFLVPFSASLIYAGFFKITYDPPVYTGSIDEDFISTPWAIFFGQVGVFIRVLGVGALIGLNILMIFQFRKQKRKIGQMLNSQQRDEMEKIADKTLFLLNVYQSVLMCGNQLPHTVMHVIRFAAPTFSQCHDNVIIPIGDACIMVTDSIDLMIIMAINKKMREMIWSGLKCGRENHGPSDGSGQ